MSKQLLLIRHAKSSWADFSVKDFDRPLNDRGKRDAPVMAQRLLDKKITIDAFVASPAKRAKKTAEYFISAYDRQKSEIIFIDELYLATPVVFESVIAQLDDRYNTIAVFSHNNGITDYANTLTHTRVDEMPTCAIFAVKATASSWKDFTAAEKEFLFFDYPKSDRVEES
ncbi:histidine phosphatase family protein [Terrimonas sp. NA20]|uniref:Histidine phosphatase family protein n=1 Tax=Terrimonas ginsenosidimutans TaxID=2908004 RepID=A0ABS9KUP9_9BACT|nr:histidine phosphatase family protein [Terrimonas ginsenosidimutans]MCG2616053.1 histidine phosphatase family protein [Terrimonas ginsenosidimutans]